MDDDIYFLWLDPVIEYVDVPVPQHHSFDIAYYMTLIPQHLEFSYNIAMNSYDWIDDAVNIISPFAAINHAKKKKIIKEKKDKKCST